MRMAIALGKANQKWPFGCVLVRRTDGAVMATGVNRWHASPILHGEMDALNNCVALHPKIDWSEIDLYTTGEPCAMCQGAILWCGIRVVVFGTSIQGLMDSGMSQIDVSAQEITERSKGLKSVTFERCLAEECDRMFVEAKQHRS